MIVNKKINVALSVLLAVTGQVSAPPAHAQGDEFCAMASAELLVALDGTWSMDQGAGAAWATMPGIGTMPVPLKRETAPVALNFQYDPTVSVFVVTGPGVDEQIIARPVGTANDNRESPIWSYAETMLTEGLSESDTSAGECDWYALPIVIGSNLYPFEEYRIWRENPSYQYSEGILDWPAVDGAICEIYGRIGVELGIDPGSNDWLDRRDGTFGVNWDRECSNYRIETSGFMRMTLVIRFADANTGSGNLLFSGVQEGNTFAAMRPVWLSR